MTVDELAKKIESKFDRFDVWRSALGQWVVKIERWPDSHSITSDSLQNAMEAAEAYQFLPRVPRRQKPIDVDGAKIVKTNGSWLASGYFGSIRRSTKKEAIEAVHQLKLIVDQQIEDWDRDYGWTVGKVEGVDFRWQ